MSRGYDGTSQGQLFLPGDHTEREKTARARTRRAAARTTASHATDTVDCAELLAMLGLHPAEGKP